MRGESFAPATVPYGGNALTITLPQRERGHVSENEKALNYAPFGLVQLLAATVRETLGSLVLR